MIPNIALRQNSEKRYWGIRSVFEVCREAVRVRRLRGQVGFASRCAPIGPLATPRDPRARLCPQAGRTDASPVRPARATPGNEACAAARFSAKADDRARCATAEARLQRGVLRGSCSCHARRALRFASRPAASGGGPRGDGSPFASPAARRSPAGGVHPASATRFRRAGSRWRRSRLAQRPRRGYPPRLAANAAPAPLAPEDGAVKPRTGDGALCRCTVSDPQHAENR